MISIIYLLFCVLPVKAAYYSLIINEKSSITEPIYSFARSYELISNFQSSFALSDNNTKLILTKVIDRDSWCSQSICSCDYCSFVLELFSNHNQVPMFSTINITVSDINDHTCQFVDTQTTISMSESVPIGHRFPITRAIDYDSGVNGKVSFKLLTNEDYFQLDAVALSINEYFIYGIVKQSLDREANERYELIIEARDHGLPVSRINRTKVTIELLDENDNAPKFGQAEYSVASLPENTPVGTELLTISASDPDKGLNGLIHYSIINPPSPATFPFVINSTTGVVILNSSLDYESTKSYRFLVRASDSSPVQALFTDTWLSITIKDINDCSVEILFLPNRRFQYENQKLFLYENTEIRNLTLGYIRLFDRDSNQEKLSIALVTLEKDLRQEYELVPSNQLNSYILIAKQGLFDREVQTEINLRFIATDSLLTSIYDLKIHLIDLNDNPSEFLSNPLQFFVEESAKYHMVDRPVEDYQITIGYLNAIDRDEGENALNRYELEPNALVRVDSNTGRLYLVQPLDREQVQSIELKATAINLAEPKWVTDVQIQIQVLDVNDNSPRCLTAHNRLVVRENFSIEKPLIKINASDADFGTNGTINYRFRTNSTWPFEMDEITGEIYSKKPFDYESEFKSFHLIVELEDNGQPRKNSNEDSCYVEIFLEDVNDNGPELVDLNQTKVFIDIDRPFESEILVLNVKDNDSGHNGKIKYYLQSIESNFNLSNNQTLFQLNQNGSLSMAYKINQICLIKLMIVLEDCGHPSKRTSVEINVAFGSSLDVRYSSYEKVYGIFQEKDSKRNEFAFIIALTVLIMTVLFLISIFLTYALILQHRHRRKAAIISRSKLLCLSSQQLTTSDSIVTSNTTSSSIEHPQTSRLIYSKEKPFSNPRFSINCSTPESHTYKILHIPLDMQPCEKEKLDNVSSDHGYHESYHTGSSSTSSTSPDQYSSETSVRRDYMFNQLPYFVTKCRSLSEGFIVEMNVDGSDEDAR